MTARARGRSRRAVLWPTIAIVTLLATGWLIYRPALSGTFLLDDHTNLGGLQSVEDFRSALNFVLSGDSGPLGRPLALASFLPQASAWGLDAAPFLHVNILVHLLNGLLVFLFSRQLARAVLHSRTDTALLALATTSVWLFMPLLASSSLLIVQRMTTLSATFVLGGLSAYLLARRRLEARPNAALLAMSTALVLATVLAAFTKENGALLPVFVLVLETTVLCPPKNLSRSSWNAWRGVFLAMPALLIVAFLILQVPYAEEAVARRNFTAAERLFSEARILWEYLFNAFFGWSGNLGPFHEWRPTRVLFTEPWTIAAIAAWIIVFVTALRVRRRYPVAAFAALWFLGGHLLESTTIPLELYFEHRNYLPIIGPVFALCYFATRVAGRYRAVSRIALASYVALNAAILFGVTSMWGQPLLAAAYWHERHPASVRAATTLATHQLSTIGPDAAVGTLRAFAARHPEHAYIRLPELNLACTLNPSGDHAALLVYLRSELPLAAFTLTTGEMLDQLLSAAVSSNCEDVTPATIADLATAVMENPRYAASIRYNQIHHTLLARTANVSGDIEKTLEHLSRAAEIGRSDDLNMMIITTLVAAGRFDEAREYVGKAAEDLPRLPLQRYNSKTNLDELKIYVEESERLAEASGRQLSGD
jgi:tetratricopeptide (TPR) repeat protein